jgi:hypothetical protein
MNDKEMLIKIYSDVVYIKKSLNTFFYLWVINHCILACMIVYLFIAYR